jgi:hypothetical protein
METVQLRNLATNTSSAQVERECGRDIGATSEFAEKARFPAATRGLKPFSCI